MSGLWSGSHERERWDKIGCCMSLHSSAYLHKQAGHAIPSASLEDAIRHSGLRLAWSQLSQVRRVARFFIILTTVRSPTDGRQNDVSLSASHGERTIRPWRLEAFFCPYVIGLKWAVLVCPNTEVLFGVSLRWEKPDYPQEPDIIAWAVSNLYRLDLSKPCCCCSAVSWVPRCHLAFIWWCNCILGSF